VIKDAKDKMAKSNIWVPGKDKTANEEKKVEEDKISF